jgi:hypothetical protein
VSRVRQRLSSEAGVGLVSVLVAIVLLAIGLVALSSASAFMASLQTDAAERTTASAIAVAYMEQVKIQAPSSLASEDPVRVGRKGLVDESGAFIRRLTVADEPSIPNTLRATVDVTYPAGFGRLRTVTLVTVIYRD